MILARDLDPLNPNNGLWLGGWYAFMELNHEAISEVLKVREIAPNSPLSNLILGIAYAQDGQFEKAIIEHEVFTSLWRPTLGTTYAMSGKIDQAREILEEIEQNKIPVRGLFLAQLYTLLGNKDAAFRVLNESLDIPAAFAGMIRYDPRLENLRSDPRYNALLRRMNLGK